MEKKKKKSGSQFRKERAARDQEQKKNASTNWLAQSGYIGGQQFSEDGPNVELPVYGLAPSVLLPILNAAVLQLEQGQFYSAAYLWDGFSRDERIGAALETRIDGTVGAELDLRPSTDEQSTAETVKEEVEKDFVSMAPIPQLYQLERFGLGLSAGIAQVISKQEIKNPDTGEYELQWVGGHDGDETTLYVWNNRYLRYDWLLRKYRLVTQNRGEITIEPGDNEWVVYEPYGPRGWLHGALIRQLVMPWFLRYWTRQWWGRRQEVHGQPIRLGIIPAERDPADEKLFLTQLKNIAHEAVIRIPQGMPENRFDVKLLEANSADWQGFMELLKHCDDSISTSILGQRQSTAGQGGLGTQEKAGETTIVRLLKKDAAQLAQTLREQYLKPYCEAKYGNAELAPYIKWQVEPPEDLEKKSTQFQKMATALQRLSLAPNFSRHIDIRALLESFDIPLIPEDKVPPEIPYSVNAKSIDMAPEAEPDEDTSDEQPKPPGEEVPKDEG